MEQGARRQANELLSALADGDRAAFTPLFQLLWPVVERFCRRALGADGHSEDAAQQALIRLFEQASDFDRAGDAVTWALAIAAWECRTSRRRSERRREVPLPAADSGSQPLDTDPVVIRELEAAAIEVLGDLRTADVRVILAAVTEQPRLRTGLSPSAFRKRLQRALERLRVAWRSRHGAL